MSACVAQDSTNYDGAYASVVYCEVRTQYVGVFRSPIQGMLTQADGKVQKNLSERGGEIEETVPVTSILE
jgi:hypothetical protein